MKNLFFIIFIFMFCNFSFASEIKVIDLYNESIDPKIKKALDQNLDLNESNLNQDLINENNDIQINDESNELIEGEASKLEIEVEVSSVDVVISNEILEFSYLWEKINPEDLIFLFKNINDINSPALKNELFSIFDNNNSTPRNFNDEDFEKLIIEIFLSLGDRKKAYEKINLIQDNQNKEYDLFYKEFQINYLLSTYKLSEACDFRDENKELKSRLNNNFFLKVDILCLVLEEKFDEANLINSLLDESLDPNSKDEYFHFLFNNLQNININIETNNFTIDPTNAFLYSAMHRVGNIPLTDTFLNIDPLNLSIPIILSNSTNIELRLKAAHIAYFNKLLNIDSLSALYQVADFSFDELNDPSSFLQKFNQNVEIGMAYYYQLINIQLLPKTRLEAILKFWDFAEKNNLELIAYELSLKNLNSIEPSDEFLSYAPEISKAYIYSRDLIRANKWILFFENSILDKDKFYNLNSSNLLFNIFNLDDSESLINILYGSFKDMNLNLNENSEFNFSQNEILYLIFSVFLENNENFIRNERKIIESRLMPSIYVIEKIRNSISSQNDIELLLSILASINGKQWSEIHPEHLRLILLGLKSYNNNLVLDKVLLEILEQCNII